MAKLVVMSAKNDDNAQGRGKRVKTTPLKLRSEEAGSYLSSEESSSSCIDNNGIVESLVSAAKGN